jgi:hypothetical protein
MQNFNPIALIEKQLPELRECYPPVFKRASRVKVGAIPLALWGLGALALAGIGTAYYFGRPYFETWSWPDKETFRKQVSQEQAKMLPVPLGTLGGGLLGAGLGAMMTKEDKNRLRNVALGGLLGAGAGYVLPYVMNYLKSSH